MERKVTCIHIGARAHYLLPKSLEVKGLLDVLITDTWVRSGLTRHLLNKAPARMIKSFSSRYTTDIPSSKVKSFSLKFAWVEVYIRLKKLTGWKLILARNLYFQQSALNLFKHTSAHNAVLAISYTAHDVFELAAKRKQKKVLFQIDPGILEEKIVAELVNRYQNQFHTTWEPATPAYWTAWKKECELADNIMVNSNWSMQGLLSEGIEAEKIKVLPLPFDTQTHHQTFHREYPQQFSKERPLRCLFLGTLTLRKGIHLVLEAARLLIDYPVEFILVGQSELDMSLFNSPNVSYKGVSARAETDMYYKSSDVFLFPTLSDGFGLTQLEAFSWKLPVIASKYCGDVVTDGVDGMLLNDCDTDALVAAIKECLNNTALLKQLSANTTSKLSQFTVARFAEQLATLL
jgi:glycosyltransferase involved in cell wall biosynthesis